MDEANRKFLADLQGKLTLYFNMEEIETLAFILGVDYDSLRGTTKPTKVNSLIADMARNGRLAALLREAARQRTNVTWPRVPQGFTMPASSDVGEAAIVYNIGKVETGGGGFVGGNIHAGGAVRAGSKGIAGDETTGSRYEMSGDFRGAVVNIGSRLDHVTQIIGDMPAIRPSQQAVLERLMEDLKVALSRVPEQHRAAAEAVARRMEALGVEAAVPQPDRDTLARLSEILRKAARQLADVAPDVIRVVGAIVEIILALSK